MGTPSSVRIDNKIVETSVGRTFVYDVVPDVIKFEDINKVQEGRPHIVDLIKNGQIDLIVNTTEGRRAIADSAEIRSSALQHKVYYTTTLAGAEAVCQALAYEAEPSVSRLQELHSRIS